MEISSDIMEYNWIMKRDRILVISPHPDDETLGMGGTIAKLIKSGSEIFILTV